MDELAEGFKALADPTRLRLLNLLRHGELCVCDLMEALEIECLGGAFLHLLETLCEIIQGRAIFVS